MRRSEQEIGSSFKERSLEQLEGVWSDSEGISSLIKRCHSFRKKPLGVLNTEELRTLIGQRIGLSYLLPIALEVLDKNPLAEGDVYAGDLLVSVVNSIPDTVTPRELAGPVNVCRTAISSLEVDDYVQPETLQLLRSFVETHQ